MLQIDQDECVNGKKNNENSIGYYSPRNNDWETISSSQNKILLSPRNDEHAIAT